MNSGNQHARTGDDSPLTWAFLTGVQTLETARASLLLRDKYESVLEPAATVGIDPDIVHTIRVTVGQGIAGVVAQRGILFFGTHRGETFLSVPVMSQRGVEGVLNLTNRIDGEPYTESHIETARVVAGHLGKLLDFEHETERAPAIPRESAPAGHDAALHPLGYLDIEETLERELARSKRMGNPFSLAIVQLVAGTGVARRESLIKAVSRSLQAHLRRYDLAEHIGDGRYAVILGSPAAVNEDIAGRLMHAATACLKGMDVNLSVRVGLAHCPRDGMSAQQLLSVAEERARGLTDTRTAASS